MRELLAIPASRAGEHWQHVSFLACLWRTEARILRYLALENDERVWTVAEGRGQGQRAGPCADGRGDRITSGPEVPEEESDMHANPDLREIRDLLQRSGTVAVVGLSDRPSRTSHAIAGALQGFGFKIYPVNPNLRGPVLGEEPYETVQNIPTPVDIVDVFRRSGKVMPVAQDAVAAGAKVLWMQSGVINEEAAAYAEEHGLTVVMDRCIKVDYATLVGVS
jgi:predicted CoA-binding protein